MNLVTPALAAQLGSGARQLGVTLTPRQLARYEDYLRLLSQWNRIYNLTAITQPEEMIQRHILDSLAVLPYVQGSYAIDVGSGAGLPGLILAVVQPEVQWTLLDSNGKKARFLRQAVTELAMDNVQIVWQRAEDHRPERGFDTVVVRAVGRLSELFEQLRHLGGEQGILLAMKGRYPAQELAEIQDKDICCVYPLQVPGLAAQRHVVKVTL